ncbi:brachyurin-like [Cloeon dipterum]|uniref:brachyurin-like n=1 Tax=Cloeon dipterum TaxID=197152 RepID=UPI00321FB037
MQILVWLVASLLCQNVVSVPTSANGDTSNGNNKMISHARATRPVSKTNSTNKNVPKNKKPDRKASVSAFIINGRTTKRGEFPHQVAIYMDEEHFCGGSLISNTHVLTAAHCVATYKSFELIFGASNRDGSDSGVVRMKAKNKIQHPSYSTFSLVNDIALLVLPKPVKFTSAIKKISLASPTQTKNLLQKGALMTVAGWGKTSDAEETIGDVLLSATLRVLSSQECNRIYGYENYMPTAQSSICVIGNKQSATCQGDSGGPVIMKENNLLYQVGIVSYGSANGCEAGDPEVLTRVASYRNWISSVTGVKI